LAYNEDMVKLTERMGVFFFLLLGVGLTILGLLALNHVVDNFWPIDTTRLDLVRSTALGRADATALLRAANPEMLLAFLASVIMVVAGLVLPVAYFLNERFGPGPSSSFLVVLRQAMWVGIWFAFCIWLQMNRTFGLGVAVLAAVVFVIIEVMLQIRARAAELSA
jgi:hypothetical protein